MEKLESKQMVAMEDNNDHIEGEHLKVATGILARLGEELTPDPDQGIMELVRNSYDADATDCVIEIIVEATNRTSLLISDNGEGMDYHNIKHGWLVLGKSRKSEYLLTKKGRIPVGDKGLGRLAALRMGKEAILISRPASEPGIEYEVCLDWDKYDTVEFLEDVKLDIKRRVTDKSSGIEILITDLRIPLNRREIERLARHILLLSDPFSNATGFNPSLIAPGYDDIERKVRNAYFDEAEYHLIAEVNGSGIADVRVVDWKGSVRWHTENLNPEKQFSTVAARFDLWVFLLDSKTFSSRNATKKEVKEWLKVVGGVHLYQRHLRVRPYGDSGHDWLEMNLSRVKSPEERPSTNTSIGRVILQEADERLVQKTDRMGFIENDAFHELKRFAKEALDWMAKMRLKEAEARRAKERQDSTSSVKRRTEKLDEIIKAQLPDDKQIIVKKAIEEYKRAVGRETEALREDLQLYRSLATAGTTSAVFAHEASKPATQIEKVSEIIKIRGEKAFGQQYSLIGKQVELIRKSAQSLRSFASLPLYLLKRDKRRGGNVNVHDVIEAMRMLFGPFLENSKILLNLEFVDSVPFVVGSVALLEAIIANLITNTINAFKVEGARTTGRQVTVRTLLSGEKVLIQVMDNALGIVDIDLDEIWLPGRTTFADGTGFGLSIVRDAVNDLSGKVYAIPQGEMGGAEFTVELPIAGGNGA
ncbi:sensor histidine kinase [Geomonas propionica]|uniref:histidine kinase n=1 Tax=Geomonas propionica TaxID=2798582 RepID=A0ABS0YKX8_9BACT|nr:sensor histidine kinase [Geomonas propionica]MBJ6798546.1 sensor histidine kinase [Geomonas propionica]